MDCELGVPPLRATGQKASLAIGCLPWICRTRLADLLVAFGRIAPAVDVGVHEMPRADLLSGLNRGDLNLVVMPTRPLTDFPNRALWRDRAMLAVAQDHPLASLDEVTLAMVVAQTLLIARQDQGTEMHRFLADRIGVADALSCRLCDVGLPRLLAHVATGSGTALVPATTAIGEGVRLLPIASERGAFNVRAYWRGAAPAWPLSALIASLSDATSQDQVKDR